jgi:hypothetical protein
MEDQPPQPPAIAPEDVDALIAWLDATAAWLRHEQSIGRAHGHSRSTEAAANLRVYADSALLLREAYGLIAPE